MKTRIILELDLPDDFNVSLLPEQVKLPRAESGGFLGLLPERKLFFQQVVGHSQREPRGEDVT